MNFSSTNETPFEFPAGLISPRLNNFPLALADAKEYNEDNSSQINTITIMVNCVNLVERHREREIERESLKII